MRDEGGVPDAGLWLPQPAAARDTDWPGPGGLRADSAPAAFPALPAGANELPALPSAPHRCRRRPMRSEFRGPAPAKSRPLAPPAPPQPPQARPLGRRQHLKSSGPLRSPASAPALFSARICNIVCTGISNSWPRCSLPSTALSITLTSAQCIFLPGGRFSPEALLHPQGRSGRVRTHSGPYSCVSVPGLPTPLRKCVCSCANTPLARLPQHTFVSARATPTPQPPPPGTPPPFFTSRPPRYTSAQPCRAPQRLIRNTCGLHLH